MTITLPLRLDIPVRPMDARGLIKIIKIQKKKKGHN